MADKGSIYNTFISHNVIPVSSLPYEEEELEQVLEGSGLVNRTLKLHKKEQYQKFAVNFLFVFGNDIDAKKIGFSLAKNVASIVGGRSKELSQNVIEKLNE